MTRRSIFLFFAALQISLLCGSVLGYVSEEKWPQPLRDKLAAFRPAYQLVQQKDYAGALPIFQQNIQDYPEAETIDYDYVWGFLCLAELGRFKEMEEYYALILDRGYNGTVRDATTDMERDWKERISRASTAFNRHIEEPGAYETLRKLAAMEEAHRKPSTIQNGPFSTTYSARRRLAEYSLAGLSTYGQSWTVLVSRDQLLTSPPWTRKESPPLSFSRAAALASAELNRKGMTAPVRSISLSFLPTKPDSTLPDRWFYKVDFGNIAKKKTVPFPDESVYLLMDGTILVPRTGNHLPKYEDE